MEEEIDFQKYIEESQKIEQIRSECNDRMKEMYSTLLSKIQEKQKESAELMDNYFPDIIMQKVIQDQLWLDSIIIEEVSTKRSFIMSLIKYTKCYPEVSIYATLKDIKHDSAEVSTLWNMELSGFPNSKPAPCIDSYIISKLIKEIKLYNRLSFYIKECQKVFIKRQLYPEYQEDLSKIYAYYIE